MISFFCQGNNTTARIDWKMTGQQKPLISLLYPVIPRQFQAFGHLAAVVSGGNAAAVSLGKKPSPIFCSGFFLPHTWNEIRESRRGERDIPLEWKRQWNNFPLFLLERQSVFPIGSYWEFYFFRPPPSPSCPNPASSPPPLFWGFSEKEAEEERGVDMEKGMREEGRRRRRKRSRESFSLQRGRRREERRKRWLGITQSNGAQRGQGATGGIGGSFLEWRSWRGKQEGVYLVFVLVRRKCFE